jgi:TrmH family RNA methyltransferase
MRIDSPSNARVVAAVRAIADGEAVLLEGERMLMDALDAELAPREVFHLEEANAPLLARAERAGASLVAVSPRVLARLSDLPSTRGMVALASIPRREAAEIPLPGGGLALALDGVQDPANVGAILRSAEAFGCAAALLTEGCANPFSARALRASSGSALRLPLATGLAPEEVVAWARVRKAKLVGADAHGGSPAAAGSGTMLLVIGSEGRGISEGIAAELDIRITIPLGGGVESLNAAVAAGILLYALSPNTSAVNR